eukprot:CAMPEP_0184716090 /NCGR_PEP_ID=MMETSP0314-20130426/5898_1 /TAXON_ID=38298 /ORGANISM="Rhodella maculata, Strain CCMP 736" /LENGTH=400 /DNA_ID=CAMNT_0027179419 /DNA_START=27 /DNA_END=1229 /DNA_ORIENTATION=-
MTDNTPHTIRQVCIVGAGNASHALAALFPSRGIRTVWFAPYADEAARINAALAEPPHSIEAHFAPHNTPAGLVTGRPEVVSRDAAEVIPESDVIIMPLPSFAYAATLKEIKPYVKKGTYIGVTPGQGGFDWIAHEVLGDVANDLIFFAVMPMPFSCRTIAFGRSVRVQSFRKQYRVATVPESCADNTRSIVTQLFGNAESDGHFITATLYPINPIVHPQRLYRLCKDWAPGDVLPENPPFYEALDDESVAYMETVNAELIQVGNALTQEGLPCNIPRLYDFYSWVYADDGIRRDTLKEIFSKNDAYKGFFCPFTPVENGFVPDFGHRYFTEDIPFGLCVYKGLADIVGVDTPMIDTIIGWAQAHMGKEYVVDGRLGGKDVGETSAPQRFGKTSVADLKGY